MSSEFSAPRVSRVVTGHSETGEPIIAADEQIRGTELAEDAGRVGATFFPLWATHQMPVDLSDAAMVRRREGSATTMLGSCSGSVLRIGVPAPGTPIADALHREPGLRLCLEGECDVERDSGDGVTRRTGDVVIQRGTNHVWHKHGATACRLTWIPVDAGPVAVGGHRLGQDWNS